MNDSNQNESSQGSGCSTMAVLGVCGAIGCFGLMGPYFLNKTCCTKMSEGKQYVGSMNRSQQAYYFEKNGFSNDFNKLGLGIDSETEDFFYVMRATSETAFNYAIPRSQNLVGFVGGVFVGVDPASLEKTTFAILCQTTDPGIVIPAKPQMENGVPTCGTGTERLGSAILLRGGKMGGVYPEGRRSPLGQDDEKD